MKKSVRKILVLVLTLVLICTLATAAFATPTSIDGDTKTCGVLDFHTQVEGDSTYGMVRMVTENETSTMASFSGRVWLSYTICPEDQIRPTYYEEGTTSAQSFTKAAGARFKVYMITDSTYCMIDATGHTYVEQTVSGTKYTVTASPVTLDLL